MRNFPNLVVDNFLKNPYELVKFAKSLEYQYPDDFRYPGLRSHDLNTIDSTLFLHLGDLILTCYGIRTHIFWQGTAHFQVIDNNYEQGWIHADRNVVTAILYLSKQPGSGTDLFVPKKFWKTFVDRNQFKTDHKKIFYKNLSENPNYKISELEMQELQANREMFNKTMSVDSVFNRLFAFESFQFHAAANLRFDADSPRLTLIYFFSTISIEGNSYPLNKL